jgi:hypothetical protein
VMACQNWLKTIALFQDITQQKTKIWKFLNNFVVSL